VAAPDPVNLEKKYEIYLEHRWSHRPTCARRGARVRAGEDQRGRRKYEERVVKGAKTAGEAAKDGLPKTGEVITDAWITTHVHARFVGEDLLKDSDISVDTSKHVVTLTGTVTRWAGRTKAGDITKRTEGVYRVVNRLTVGSKRTD